MSGENDDIDEPVRIPLEPGVDRIAPIDDQNKIKNVLDWADLLHKQAHSPWGVNWQTVYTAVIAMGAMRECADECSINPRYRMRIDAPMSESELEGMSDTFPEYWSAL